MVTETHPWRPERNGATGDLGNWDDRVSEYSDIITSVP
jgi:hypothetical protein